MSELPNTTDSVATITTKNNDNNNSKPYDAALRGIRNLIPPLILGPKLLLLHYMQREVS